MLTQRIRCSMGTHTAQSIKRALLISTMIRDSTATDVDGTVKLRKRLKIFLV